MLQWQEDSGIKIHIGEKLAKFFIFIGWLTKKVTILFAEFLAFQIHTSSQERNQDFFRRGFTIREWRNWLVR